MNAKFRRTDFIGICIVISIKLKEKKGLVPK